MPLLLRQRSALPGFGLTLGLAVTYLGLIVLVPLSSLFLKSATAGWAQFWQTVTDERVLASLRLTFQSSLVAALANAVFGTLVAWVLVRYRFPARRFLDAIIDIPFALPTAVSGIALTALYAPNGWLGKPLAQWGLNVAFTPLGIIVAMTFIGLPFVVRTLQPAIEEIENETEEAATVLGASRLQTFRRVIFPSLLPPLLTGFALAFARALGEYGSVIFIAGNMPMISEITPLLIVIKLEQYDYAGAAGVAVVMLVISFALLVAINLLQRWSARRLGAV